MSSVHAQALPDNLSGIQANSNLMNTVSPIALERADGNQDLAITMQVTSKEAMSILTDRGHRSDFAKGWQELASAKTSTEAVNDNEAPIAIVA